MPNHAGKSEEVLMPGFLGTRADMLMDIVLLSFIVILPVLIWSWQLARHKRQYRVVID
jgi:hypothetical protein